MAFTIPNISVVQIDHSESITGCFFFGQNQHWAVNCLSAYKIVSYSISLRMDLNKQKYIWK